ncbi:MAG TPA: DUF4157 domain-containing protein [Terracidiphilus sp.]|jgi:hypothetical protein
MAASAIAEPKAKKKAEVSPEPLSPLSELCAAATPGAPAGMPLYLGSNLQRKLALGSVDDPLETEADRMAEQVMQPTAAPSVQNFSPLQGSPGRQSALRRKCACGGKAFGECEECKEREEELAGSPLVRRRASPGMQTGGRSPGEAPPIVHQALRRPGRPLDPSVRSFMERGVGRDLSQVRVHTDSLAGQSAAAVNALAYTTGNDVVFAAGKYAPGSLDGGRLLAHELAHVLQQRDAQNGVVRRQPKSDQGSAVVDGNPEPKIEDVFAAKQYDMKSKEGALAYAQDWHTQYLRNYQPYMTAAYDQAPGDVGISFARQQVAGRAFFIYTEFYWPQIQKLAETVSPFTLFHVINDDVNATDEEAQDEEQSAKRINPRDYRTLFPETAAREYDREAKNARAEAIKETESVEGLKVAAAARRDKSTFVLFGDAEYRPRFYAELLEEEAARIRKGQWSVLPFSDKKLFFWIDADTKGESVAASEYDAYIERADNPDKAWSEALGNKQQWAGDLDKENKTDKDLSGTEKDLVQLTIVSSSMRNKAGRDVLQPEVIDAWNTADRAMISVAPAVAKDELSDDLKEKTRLPVELFFETFWDRVVAPDGPVRDEDLDSLILDARSDLSHATNKDGWKVVFADYNDVVDAMDNYIAGELRKKGRDAEAQQLQVMGGRVHALTDLLQEHRNATKVRAVYYPEDKLENAGTPGLPDFAAEGIQLFFYMYRDDGKWNLVDVTTPQQVKVTSGSGGNADTPDMGIFQDLNSKLRFPKGRIYFSLPDGTNWVQACTEPRRLSEFLTWIGLGVAAVGLAIVTAGASIPAELLILGAAVGVGAGVADLIEKKSAGVLTRKDIAVDGLQIAASLLTAGSAKLGQVVISEAAAAGISVAEVGTLAGKLLIPVTLAAAGADVASFAVLAADSIEALRNIDSLPGTDEDRKMAKLRILAQLIGMGALTFFGVKSNLKGLAAGENIKIDAEPGGQLSASALSKDAELLKLGSAAADEAAAVENTGTKGLEAGASSMDEAALKKSNLGDADLHGPDEGHKIFTNSRGAFRCSEPKCPNILVLFSDVLENQPALREEIIAARKLGQAGAEQIARLTERMRAIRGIASMSDAELERAIQSTAKLDAPGGTLFGDDLRFAKYRRGGGVIESFDRWQSANRSGSGSTISNLAEQAALALQQEKALPAIIQKLREQRIPGKRTINTDALKPDEREVLEQIFAKDKREIEGLTLAEVQAARGRSGAEANLLARQLTQAEDALAESYNLRRPSLRKDTKQTIQNATRKTPDGRYIDPDGVVRQPPYQYGHIYGRENRRLIVEAGEHGMSQAEFNDWVNSHPEWFEMQSEEYNLSHIGERPGNN